MVVGLTEVTIARVSQESKGHSGVLLVFFCFADGKFAFDIETQGCAQHDPDADEARQADQGEGDVTAREDVPGWFHGIQ